MASTHALPLTGETDDTILMNREERYASEFLVTVHRAFDDAAQDWAALAPVAISTPYQTYGWSKAAFEHLDAGSTIDPLIVAARNRDGEIAALLPLCVTTKYGLRVAMFPGGKHANANMAVMTEAFARSVSKAAIEDILRSAAKKANVDLYRFRNQPFTWDGVSNPLGRLAHVKAASSSWRADLISDGEEMLRGLMSSESRKKLRHKERKLADLGAISYIEARSQTDTASILAAFLTQKERRFQTMGVHNPFAEVDVQRFLHATCIAAMSDGARPPVSLFAMKAGERVLAVFGGTIDNKRFSGMFTSFDSDPTVSKYSPGDLLLLNLIKMMCAEGLSAFDLGVGDAAYKGDYCRIEEPVFDSALPMTLQGQVAATIIRNGFKLKRRIKNSAGLSAALKRILRR